MPKEFDFGFVEKEIRKKTFGILSTIDSNGRPHSTGILYGLSPTTAPFRIYMLASKKYQKVKNIQRDPQVSFVITFPHFYIRFAPASYVMFRGAADIIPFDDETARKSFQAKRILRMNINSDYDERDMVFIRIAPGRRVVCYGLGYGIMDLRSDHTSAGYSVSIPEERL